MQLSLDFSPRAVTDGKKLERIPVAVSADLKAILKLMADNCKISISEKAHQYIVEGIQRDIGKLFTSEIYLNDSLRSFLQKNF